jgi:uncharacterized protein YbjT (DUF2867 family)
MVPACLPITELWRRVVSGTPRIERLLHFSEMAAHERHASRRLASKAAGDVALMAAAPHATILKCVGSWAVLTMLHCHGLLEQTAAEFFIVWRI